MRECREPYFTILHDDDRLEPDHLEFTLSVSTPTIRRIRRPAST
jgi:hypothetical protein